MRLPNLQEIEDGAQTVYREFAATPQYRWEQLSGHLGAACWIKHENHTPVGAFKIRGGLTYFEQMKREGRLPKQVISATRGNHGQSIAWAARLHGVGCQIVAPVGNSVEKNAAMRALGADLILHGEDFQASRDYALALAGQSGAQMVPSFHFDLMRGVASYWLEFLRALPDLEWAFVPLGLGSGVCSAIAAKLALGHRVRLVAVVSAHATTYPDSLAAGKVVAAPVNTALADGVAVRTADADALALIGEHVHHIAQVTDAQVAEAMREIFRATHNVAEGAGAATYAAAYQERNQLAGSQVGVVLSGGNVDSAVFAQVLRQT